MLGFFKKKNKQAFKGWSEVFREKSQVFYPLPDMKKIRQGFFLCHQCRKQVCIEEFKGLSIENCPDCQAANFIPLKLNDFWLFAPLAVGSSSRVYKAVREDNPDFELAVKLLPEDKQRDEESIKGLLHEAEVGMLMGQHPHLVEVFEYDRDHSEYFMVTEFIDGVRLDDIINSSIKRPQAQVILWTLQILKALNHVYEHGYLYRGINTKNTMIDNDGNVKLVDYGLAVKPENSKQDNREFIKGTIHYIPPERLRGEAENESSDIYSLGLLLYQMLTREQYFPGESVKEIAQKHLSPLRMENLALKMPAGTHRDLIKIIHKMIKCDPAERFQSFFEAGVHLMEVFDKISEGR